MATQLFCISRGSFADSGEGLLEEIEDAQLAIEAAQNLFSNTADPLQVDQAILSEQAARKRYSYVMAKIRSQNLSALSLCPIRLWHKRGVNNKE